MGPFLQGAYGVPIGAPPTSITPPTDGGEAPKLRQNRPARQDSRFHSVNEAAQHQEADRDLDPDRMNDDDLLDEDFGDLGDECPDEIAVI